MIILLSSLCTGKPKPSAMGQEKFKGYNLNTHPGYDKESDDSFFSSLAADHTDTLTLLKEEDESHAEANVESHAEPHVDTEAVKIDVGEEHATAAPTHKKENHSVISSGILSLSGIVLEENAPVEGKPLGPVPEI